MPICRVEIISGYDQNYKTSVLDSIHSAIVSAFKVPENDRIQKLYELDRENFLIPNSKYSEKFVQIEITVFQGRSKDAKRNLYYTIVENLKRNPGIDGNDIIIILNEVPLENWGIRGGIPADELDLGFEVKV
jgi:phenylpyruvate tautomerase PptA (4-oxalocrotonate tautomerase family)